MTPTGRDWTGIPKDNEELFRDYLPFMRQVIARSNKVNLYTQDVEQHLFMKICESNIPSAYRAHLERKRMASLPSTMTGKEAADFLGIKWPAFKVAIWRGRYGDVRKDGTRRPKVDLPTEPVEGHWSHPLTVWRIEDILRMRGYFKSADPSAPAYHIEEVKPTKAHFMAYLSRSIKNHFANWCRTHQRRYGSERVQNPMEDGTPWEATLKDKVMPSGEPWMVLQKTVETIKTYPYGDDVLGMLGDGYSLPEVVSRMKLPRSFLTHVRETARM